MRGQIAGATPLSQLFINMNNCLQFCPGKQGNGNAENPSLLGNCFVCFGQICVNILTPVFYYSYQGNLSKLFFFLPMGLRHSRVLYWPHIKHVQETTLISTKLPFYLSAQLTVYYSGWFTMCHSAYFTEYYTTELKVDQREVDSIPECISLSTEFGPPYPADRSICCEGRRFQYPP